MRWPLGHNVEARHAPPEAHSLVLRSAAWPPGEREGASGGACHVRHCAWTFQGIAAPCAQWRYLATPGERAAETVVAALIFSIRGLARAKFSSLSVWRNRQSGFASLRRDGLRSLPQGSRTKTGGRRSLEQGGRRCSGLFSSDRPAHATLGCPGGQPGSPEGRGCGEARYWVEPEIEAVLTRRLPRIPTPK